MKSVLYKINPRVQNDELNALFRSAWLEHSDTDFGFTLERCLLYICAFLEDDTSKEQLVGFVKVAWDGGFHGFLLDTTVHSSVQHQGIGGELVRQAINEARARGIHWLHVDFEAQLEPFYWGCGFGATRAGLLRLN